MKKIKLFLDSEKGKDILIVVIVVLLGISSFYLGRLSIKQEKTFKIDYQAQKADILSSFEQNIPLNNAPKAQNGLINPSINEKADLAPGKYFASKIGQKYYPINCSAGKNIKLENRIYFENSNEAEKAGYELSASCR